MSGIEGVGDPVRINEELVGGQPAAESNDRGVSVKADADNQTNYVSIDLQLISRGVDLIAGARDDRLQKCPRPDPTCPLP